MTGMIAHGVDIVEIARIASMLDEHGGRFVERCFTEVERSYADSGKRLRAERYAVRFACKEAVFKAIGTGWRNGISWRDVEVRRLPSGQPRIAVVGRTAEIARELGIQRWLVSLSHTDRIALASVFGGAGESP